MEIMMEHCFEKKPNWEHKASFPGTVLIQSLGINYSVLSWVTSSSRRLRSVTLLLKVTTHLFFELLPSK